ncbi:MAG: carbohydrate kinase family protein [Clostridia bacterium]|nr:carbohydrate kinase family protein [Clostridia bacterium]
MQLSAMKQGIAVAGTILVDKINEISAYPNAGELTKILGVAKAVGGCVPNVAIDIKRIDPKLTVKAVGFVGADEESAFVKQVLQDNGVDTQAVTSVEDKTSFTEVMSVVGGQRTFFTYAGANAHFGVDGIDWDALNVKMLHLGYFLLLDKIDDGDGVKLLQKLQKMGIKTSIDLVSENSDRYAKVLPCLAYTDNLIINEVEAGQLTGVEPKRENLRAIAEKLFSYGVKERVIIHTPELGVAYSKAGYTELASYDLPKGFIKGTTGAGDAFCAGALLGIYREYSDEKILALASAAAVSALSATDAISGVREEQEIEKLCKNMERKKLC